MMFDRRGDEPLLQALEKDGWAHSLVDFAVHARLPLDLQIRGYEHRPGTWATLYMGLERVLNLHFNPSKFLVGKGFHLTPHSKLGTSTNGWHGIWEESHDKHYYIERWHLIELYLERVIPLVGRSALREGALQAGISTFPHKDLVVIDRESQLSYPTAAIKQQIQRSTQKEPLLAASQLVSGAWTENIPSNLGGECDALAIHRNGALITIEAKPWQATSTIPWAPLQARNYANLFNRWAHRIRPSNLSFPKQVLDGMADQRQRIGVNKRTGSVGSEMQVQPMVVIQRGASKVAVNRMQHVHEHLVDAGLNDPPMLFQWATMWGELSPLVF